MRKIVVFGGSGFMGSHVADVLTERGYDVTIYDTKSSRFQNKKQGMIVGDIMDPAKVARALEGVDVVYNFAGVADIDEAKHDPVNTIRQNVLGNTILLDACRAKGIKRFLFASTVYVYSRAGSFYRSSKQACEAVIEDYQRACGIDFTILRYGSLYGPRSDERNWVYKTLKQAVQKGAITRKGSGDEIREYIHVRDAARISVDVLDDQFRNQHVIISGTQPMRIKDLLTMLKEMMNNELEITYVPARHDEHYEVTPYSFSPKVAKRVVSMSYLDLGQGLLDMMNRIHNGKDITDSVTGKQVNGHAMAIRLNGKEE